MISAFSGFLSSFLSPATKLIHASQSLQEMRTDMERIEDIMEYPVDVECGPEDVGDDVEFDKLSGRIELKNVTFGYSRLAPAAYQGLLNDIGARAARGVCRRFRLRQVDVIQVDIGTI